MRTTPPPQEKTIKIVQLDHKKYLNYLKCSVKLKDRITRTIRIENEFVNELKKTDKNYTFLQLGLCVGQ